MYRFKAGATEEEYLKFLSGTEHYNVMQTPEWAKVKSGWGHDFCLVYKDETPVG